MNITDWLKAAANQLQNIGIDSAKLDAQLLLAHTLQQSKTWLITHGDEMLANNTLAAANTLLARRLEREPIAYILGYKEFYRRQFTVTPDVLIPRPETETLIELVGQLSPASGDTVLDIGTGSGAIAITVAKEWPELTVIASDVSPAALKVAKRNAAQLDTQHISFFQSDLCEQLPPLRARFIIANLPYVNTAWNVSPETAFEPQQALFAEHHGLELIYQLIEQAPAHLTPKGYLLLEADPEQHAAISAYGREHGFLTTKVQDYSIVLQHTDKTLVS